LPNQLARINTAQFFGGGFLKIFKLTQKNFYTVFAVLASGATVKSGQNNRSDSTVIKMLAIGMLLDADESDGSGDQK
jgi:hypothetical protein